MNNALMANSFSPSRSEYDGKCEISLSLTLINGHLGSEKAIQMPPGGLKGGGSRESISGWKFGYFPKDQCGALKQQDTASP